MKNNNMKIQVFTAVAICICITATLFINPANSALVVTTIIQTSGTIIQDNDPTELTVILRGIPITTLNPSSINITSWVDNYVQNHNGVTAITISDMHQYGIWWYGYSFSQTSGTWMGWTFNQIQTLISRFHYHGWKVGLESTAIAWIGQQEYNYIETQHPELAFVNAKGISAAITGAGTNRIIPDPFAIFDSPDNTNGIPAGIRLIDLYTTRLTQMIQDGLSWDFWFGGDGWNGLNLQGYSWSSANPALCYSFSAQEIDEWYESTTPNPNTVAVGSSAIGGGLNTFGPNEIVCEGYQAYVSGTSNAASVCIKSPTFPVRIQAAIYSGNATAPNTLLEQSSVVELSSESSAGGFVNFTFNHSIQLVAGQYYWLSVMADQRCWLYTSNYVNGLCSTNAFASGFPQTLDRTATWLQSPGKMFTMYLIETPASTWSTWTTEQQATYIINSQLTSWSNYWQERFAQEYSQIKQAFINAGQATDTFHVIGVADMSSIPGTGGNLGPTGMYNWDYLARYNSLDYIYVDQEGTLGTGSVYSLGHNQAYAAAAVKMQNPILNPIIGLQPVDWLGNTYPLWEVEQEYLSQAINYVWYNGGQFHVSAPNVIMLQYPTIDGWKGWSTEDMQSLFNFIKTTAISLRSVNPVWLGPTCIMPNAAYNKALLSMNYSCAQWTWADNYNNRLYDSAMNTLIMGTTIPWAGDAETINRQMYSTCNSPVTSSESLIDLKVYASAERILIPMTNQYSVGNSFSIPSSISTTLTIDTSALGLTQPAQQYSVYWISEPSLLTPLSSSGTVTITLSGGADILVIAPAHLSKEG